MAAYSAAGMVMWTGHTWPAAHGSAARVTTASTAKQVVIGPSAIGTQSGNNTPQQPTQLVGPQAGETHWPLVQVWPLAHATQALPPLPQALAVAFATQALFWQQVLQLDGPQVLLTQVPPWQSWPEPQAAQVDPWAPQAVVALPA